MRPQLHRAILRRFIIRVIGVALCVMGGWSMWLAHYGNEGASASPHLILMGLMLLVGPAALPRLQRLRMRLSVSRPL